MRWRVGQPVDVAIAEKQDRAVGHNSQFPDCAPLVCNVSCSPSMSASDEPDRDETEDEEGGRREEDGEGGRADEGREEERLPDRRSLDLERVGHPVQLLSRLTRAAMVPGGSRRR